MAWYRQVKGADWATPADVKRAIRNTSIPNDGRAVSNIAGNKYRIVIWTNYPTIARRLMIPSVIGGSSVALSVQPDPTGDRR
jgi:mRNA-degrading endonuclease HigB of HigAB toxin-antitoxin module